MFCAVFGWDALSISLCTIGLSLAVQLNCLFIMKKIPWVGNLCTLSSSYNLTVLCIISFLQGLHFIAFLCYLGV